jgi:hypothetical protein
MVEIITLVSHRLGRVDALDRMHQMVDSLGQRFPQQVHQVRSSWRDNKLNIRFAAYGYLVQWEAVVLEEQVSLHGQIPDAARVFKGKIEQAIVSRLETVLSESDSQSAPTTAQQRKAA